MILYHLLISMNEHYKADQNFNMYVRPIKYDLYSTVASYTIFSGIFVVNSFRSFLSLV